MFRDFWTKIKTWACEFRASFRDSEVIFWSRLQMLVGSIWLVLSSVDLSPLIGDPKWVAVWTIANGLITEFLRRRRADEPDGWGKEL